VATIGELLVEINGDNSGLKKSLGESTSSLSTAVGSIVSGAALAAAAWKGIDLAIQGINYNKAAEQATIAFGSFLGSASAAKDMIEKLRDLAKETPLEFAEVRDGAKQMSAFGIEASKLVPTMRMLADVSAGLNIPIKDLAYLFGTIKTQGKAMTVDLMQFANRGIPIWDELAKVTGKSGTELRKFVEAGGVGFPQVEQALKNMTSEGGKFFNMAVKQMDSLAGAQSNLNDNFDVFLGKITEGMSGPLKGFSNAVSNILSNFVALDKQLNSQGTNIWASVFDPIAAVKAAVAIRDTTKNVVDYADRVKYANSLQSEAVGTFNRIKDEQKAIADKAKELAEVEKTRITLNETLKQQSIAFTGSYVNIIDFARRLRDQEIENAKIEEKNQAKQAEAQDQADMAQDIAIKKHNKILQLEKDHQAALKSIVDFWDRLSKSFKYAGDQFSSLAKSAGKFGNTDLSDLLSQISDIANNAGDFMSALGKGDYIAAAVSGVALIADAWDGLFGKQTEAQKKADDQARKAEEDRISAVKTLENEYQIKAESDLKRLEKERDDRVAYARSIGADVLNIERYYAGQIAKIKIKSSGTIVEESSIAAETAAIKNKYEAIRKAQEIAIRSNEAALRKRVEDAGYRFVAATQDTQAAAYKAWQDAKKALADGVAANNSALSAAMASLDENMRSELEKVEASLATYRDRFSQAFDGISSSLVDAMKSGVSKADFKSSIMDMLRNMAIDAAIMASGFQEKFATIGTMIAEAMRNGFQEGELDSIGASIDQLYADAMAAIQPINDLFANRITAPSVPSNVIPFNSTGVPTGASPGSPAAVGGVTFNIQSNAPLDPKQTADANMAMLQAAAFKGVI
jgi:hypothetical protein